MKNIKATLFLSTALFLTSCSSKKSETIPSATPTPSLEVTATPTPSPANEQIETDATPLTKEEIPKFYFSPDSYKNRTVENLIGKVCTEPSQSNNGYFIEMLQDFEHDSNYTLIYTQELPDGIKKGDYISLDGFIYGSYEGTDTNGNELIAATIGAMKISIITEQEAKDSLEN